MRFPFGSDNSVDKTLKQAEKYVHQGKYSAAVDEYKKVLDANPNDIQLLNTIGDLCVRADRNSEAAKYFSRVAEYYAAQGTPASAIAVYKKITKVEPSNYDVALKLAEMYIRQGLLPDAKQQLKVVADRYRAEGETIAALKILKKIADLEPENTAMRIEVAEGYLAAGARKDAYQAFIQAGQELQKNLRFAECIDAFSKALEIRSDSKLALNALAEAYTRRGEVTEALRLLDAPLEAAPDDIDLNVILGRVYVMARMPEEAEKTFLRVFELDGNRYEELLEVARNYLEAESYERAMSIVDRCGEALIARGHKKKATALLKDVLKRDPDNLDALKRLGSIYRRVDEKRNLIASLNSIVQVASRLGKKDEATQALKLLVEIEPDASYYQQQLRELDKPKPAPEPAARSSKQEFPEGFESTPALMEWTRGLSDEGLEVEQQSSAYASAGNMDLSTSLAEYSTELLDEMVSQHPEFMRARINLMEELVASQPKYILGRVKLKQHYVDAGQPDKAAAQCLELARLYEEEGDTEKAKECVAEAYELNPSVEQLSANVGAAPAAEEEKFDLEDLFTIQEFNKYFDREWRRAIRDGRPLSLLKVEVDDFNGYIDTYGLLSGDYCLERLAAALESELLRPGDLISNCGAGAFFVLLPETSSESATIVAERLLKRVRDMRILYEGSANGGFVSVSMGLSTSVPHPDCTTDLLIRSSDDALLHAKIAGGDQYIQAPSFVE